MKRAVAVLRLIARPSTLWLPFVVFWAISVPFLMAPKGTYAAWSTTPTDAVWTALWRGAAIVGFVIGSIVMGVSLEVQRAFASWTIPAMRRALAVGAAIVAMLGASLIGYVFVRSGGEGAFLAAFGGTLCYAALGALCFDTGAARNLRRAASVVLVAGYVCALIVRRASVEQPSLFVAVVLLVALLLFAYACRTVVARGRVQGQASVAAAAAQGSFAWLRRGEHRASWTIPLADAGLLDWVRATFYASRAHRSVGWRSMLAIVIAVPLLIYYAPPAAFVGIATAICGPSAFLRKTLYPLSRADRARVEFMSNLLQSIAGAAALAVGVVILSTLHLPRPDIFGHMPGELWGLEVALFCCIWSPVFHWLRAEGVDVVQGLRPGVPSVVRYAVQGMLIYAPLVLLSAWLLRRSESRVSWWVLALVVAALFGAVHLTYRFLLTRRLARADLI